MKKTIILSVAILFAAIFNHSFAGDIDSTGKTSQANEITNLVINANVTVVLVNNSKAELEVAGNEMLTKLVSLTKTGETLVINSAKRKNLKAAGVIYVPAHLLRYIRVNSEANVKSLYALQAPQLDVVINGACNVSIANIGKLNLIGTESYLFEETTHIQRFPSKLLLKN